MDDILIYKIAKHCFSYRFQGLRVYYSIVVPYNKQLMLNSLSLSVQKFTNDISPIDDAGAKDDSFWKS